MATVIGYRRMKGTSKDAAALQRLPDFLHRAFDRTVLVMLSKVILLTPLLSLTRSWTVSLPMSALLWNSSYDKRGFLREVILS